ncbi:MAG: DNA polymerase III subunit beta [Betaproteobacteria bacterium]|nr:DNA polymerase III subunit beta [Betaproteobacteria bacterium]
MNLLKAPRDEFLKALQVVAGIVERRHTLPILANVLLKKQGNSLALTSSDLEIQIRTFATFDGDSGNAATTVAARKLLDILRSVPDGQNVSLDLVGAKLTVKSGKSRFALQTLPAEDFPLVSDAVEFGPAFTLPQATLKRLIGQVHFAMAVHDIRYYLNGILMVVEGKQLTLVATDGHRLAVAHAELPHDVPRQEVILPRKSVLELQRLLGDDEAATVEMKFAPNQAKVALPDIEFVSKLVEGKFPDYQRVLPKGYKLGLEVDRLTLLNALQRASILTNDKFRGVRVNFEPGVLRISSTNAEQEEAFEELDVDYQGDSIEIGFNVSYLVDALTNLHTNNVHIALQDGNSSALFTVPGDANFRYVVMPMRI